VFQKSGFNAAGGQGGANAKQLQTALVRGLATPRQVLDPVHLRDRYYTDAASLLLTPGTSEISEPQAGKKCPGAPGAVLR
jgi:hypothetical protein